MSGPRLLRAGARASAKAGALRVLDPLPFAPRRVFWISAPWGAQRGGHAHRTCQQLLIAATCRIDARCAWYARGRLRRRTYQLGADAALWVPADVWLDLEFMTSGALAVLASEPYRAAEYVRDEALWRSAR